MNRNIESVFTGIIECVGRITALHNLGGDLRVCVEAPDLGWNDVQLGDSIATNGVCLTVVSLGVSRFEADVSGETLQVTTAKNWTVGQRVNLEKALTPSSRLGGHLVSGHVDGIGEVTERRVDARSERFSIRAPASLAKYIAQKGSITVDGTSLTVNAVNGSTFELNIVPHTLAQTIIGDYKMGVKVNLEVDVIARYLERLLMGDKAAEEGNASRMSQAFLAGHGYLK